MPSFVQFSYYGAYFCPALPAAFINRRYSYKTGVLLGLGLATAGAFMFYPASMAMTYCLFLAALFALAGGLSILETSANPFVIAMGPEPNATRRPNFAQAFNPVGANLGVFLAATLILPNLNSASPEERAAMVGFAFVLLAIWIGIAMVRMPTAREAAADGPRAVNFSATIGRLVRNQHYRYGVVAQFFNN